MSDCPFCGYQGPSPILYTFGKSESVYVIEPINPVTPGHVLIIPVEHVEDFRENPYISMVTMWAASAYLKELGKDHDDWNVITSIGPNATQTVKHLHVHLVPRRKDDGLKLPWSDG